MTRRMIPKILLILLAISAPAWASEDLTSTHDLNTPRFDTPVGLGGLLGEAPNRQGQNREYAFVVEGQNHFSQRQGMYGLTQYGEGESRLELGNGVGVSLEATSGVSLYGLRGDHRWFSPHLGIEPFSGLIHWNTGDHRNNAYEWLPMASVGPQFAFGSCRLLPVLRGGGAAGNLTQAGYQPSIGSALGAGSYLNCETIDFAAETARVYSQSRIADIRVADLSYHFLGSGLKLGLRGESELAHENSRAEQRVMVILRSRIGD